MTDKNGVGRSVPDRAGGAGAPEPPTASRPVGAHPSRDEAEVHELRRLRKRRPFPIPASACSIVGVFVSDLQQIGHPKFRLRTRQQGVEITFSIVVAQGSAFSWNASALLDQWPSNFREARAWVHAYAAGYGQTIEEDVSARELRPTGADAKLLKAGGCREAWLASDVPRLAGEAAVRCQHAGGFCMSDGFCHYGTCDMEMISRDSDASLAEDPKGLSGEAVAARAEGIAQGGSHD